MGELGKLFVTVGAVTSDFSKAIKGVDAALKGTGEKAEELGRKMQSAGVPIAAAGTAIVGMAALSVRSFAKFDAAMTNSTAIMGDLSESMKKDLVDAARNVATETTFSSTEAAKAFYYLASAGLNANQSIAALPAVAKFAQAGMMDLEKATSYLMDSQSALGMRSADAAQNLTNLTRVSDVLVEAANKSNGSIEQFAGALSNSAPMMRQLNMGVEEGVAVLSVYADQGIKGEEAGTRFSIVLRDLQTRAIKNKEAFEKYNIAVFDTSGNMRNMADIISDLAKALAGKTDEQKKTILAEMEFQDRSISSMLSLVGMSDAIRKYEADLKKAGGTTQDVADKQLKSLSAQLTILKNSTELVSESLGSTLAPIVGKIAEKLTKASEALAKFIENNKGASTVFTVTASSIGIFAIGLGSVILALGTMLRAYGAIAKVFPGFASLLTKPLAPLGRLTVSLTIASGAYQLLLAIREKWEKAHGKFVDEETESWVRFTKQIGLATEVIGTLGGSMGALGQEMSKTLGADKTTEILAQIQGEWQTTGRTIEIYKKIADGAFGPEAQAAMKALGGKHLEAAMNAGKHEKAASALAGKFQQLAELTKTQLTKNLADAEAKLKELNASSEKTPGAIKLVEDTIAGLKEQLYGTTGAISGAGGALFDLGKALEGFAIKTKTQLTAELKTAEETLRQLKATGQETPGAIKFLTDTIAGLKEQLYGANDAAKAFTDFLKNNSILTLEEKKKKTQELTGIVSKLEAQYKSGQISLKDYTTGVRAASAEAKKYGVTIATDVLPEVRDLNDVVKAAPKSLDTPAWKDWGEVLKKYGTTTVKETAAKLKELNDESKYYKELLASGTISQKEYAEAIKQIREEMAKLKGQTNSTSGSIQESLAAIGQWINVIGDQLNGAWGNVVKTAGSVIDQIGQALGKGMTKFKDIAKEIGAVLAGQLGASLGQAISGSSGKYGGIGAGLGAAIGSTIIPGIGTVLGSAIGGLIGGLFGKKKKKTEEERQAEELQGRIKDVMNITAQFGKISESTAKAIAEESKQLGQAVATHKNFADVISDVGVRQENVNDLWLHAADVLADYESGALDLYDTQQSLGESFEALLAGAQKLGQEGSKAMVDFIKKVRESGVEVAEVTEYVQDQLSKIPDALSTLLAPSAAVAANIKELKDQLKDQQKELKGLKEGSKEYIKLQKEIAKTEAALEKQNLALAKTRPELERLGVIALTSFNAMIASGMTWTEAMAQMGGSLAQLRDRYKELGIDGGAALNKLLRLAGITEANKDLFNSIDANRQLLVALGNTGFLTAEALAAISKNATAYYFKLKKAGMTSKEALIAMAPSLQEIYDYAKKYGIELDKGTQYLIDQAIKAGLIVEEQESEVDIWKDIRDIMGEVGTTLKDLLNVMRGVGNEAGDVTGNFEDWKDAIEKARDAASGDWGAGMDLGATNLPAYGTGGIVSTPQIARIGEVPEAIIPLNKMSDVLNALGGGGRTTQVTVPVYLNGEKIGEFASTHIEKAAKMGRFRIPPKAVVNAL
jgi:TP901 family phage tail tape measure protein